jgi:outer membrane protein OmpA-like peptidoglycan-associated protein
MPFGRTVCVPMNVRPHSPHFAMPDAVREFPVQTGADQRNERTFTDQGTLRADRIFDSGNSFQNLSKERAVAVMNWLTDHGVDRSRLTAQGRGESNPLGDNSTDEGRAKNRRVELVRQ